MSETDAPTLADYDKAIDALDGTISIAQNEMMAHVGYMSAMPINRELAKQGAVCRGHQACFIGSLWLAGGVRRKRTTRARWDLPGVRQGWPREEFLAKRSALKLAYDASNAAAERYMKRAGIQGASTEAGFEAPAEHLFEEGLLSPAGKRHLGLNPYARPSERAIRKEMIKVLRAAKRSLRSQRDRLAAS
jgi:hypothetical protein